MKTATYISLQTWCELAGKVIRSLCLLALTVLLTVAAMTFWQWRATAKSLQARVESGDVTALLRNANTKLDAVGALAGSLTQTSDAVRGKVAVLDIASVQRALTAAADSLRGRIESDDVTGIIANLTVISRRGVTTLDKTDALIEAAKQTTLQSVATQKEWATTLQQFATLAGAASKTITDVDGLLTNPEFVAGYKAGLDALKHWDNASASMDSIMDDLAHPKHPGKFIHALGFIFALLRGGALAGQTAGLAH